MSPITSNPIIGAAKVFMGSVAGGIAAGMYIEQGAGFLYSFSLPALLILTITFILLERVDSRISSIAPDETVESDDSGELSNFKPRINRIQSSSLSCRYKRK